jgi:hypothetical protein
MIYIRNIFHQDLRDGKQIAFTTEPSNLLFKFRFSENEPDRKIRFKFKVKDNTSANFKYNDKIINTRLYSAGSESRIDGEFKQFIRDFLNAEVDDIIVFRSINLESYEFEFISKNTTLYQGYKTILNGKNHEIVLEQDTTEGIENKTISLNNNYDLAKLKEEFATWFIQSDRIKHNYFSDSFGSSRDKLLEQLTKYETLYNEQFGKYIFNLEKYDPQLFINELERNLYLEHGSFFEFSQKTSTHMPRAILGKKNYLKFLKHYLIENNKTNSKSPLVTPINKIYFGAPGTGKSHQITQDLADVDLIFQKRITFHPEYDNSSFVGGYKPITDINGEIKYEFAPQIFTNIYVQACNDPIHQYYLIIEEINRGNCAEIFGEIFQLLDRNKDYKITPSTEIIRYLNENIFNSEFYEDDKMTLPDNLSILATMNTSDQSLFPMDSAFKRRWEWVYIPINYSNDIKINKSALYKIKIGHELIDWISFIETINKKIQSNKNLGMDKCIGNYFIQPDSNNIINLDKFIYKVLFYLWNDVFKDEPKDSIFGDRSYQDFFPIENIGEQLVLKMFKELKITTQELIIDETKIEE